MMKRKKIGMLFCLGLLLAITGTATVRSLAVQARVYTAPLVVIDPGHGGADGGAVAPDGTQEKEINLAISLPLADMLRVMGYQVSLTRTTDDMVGGVGSTMRERKVNDTKNRLAQAEQAAITVSIHQNSYPEEYVHGAQVFYPSEGGDEPVAESGRAARIIQKALNSSVNRDKARAELGKNDVFLLRNITCPTVIVECGFMSSREESRKLRNTSYQAKLAGVISKSICKYIEEK